MLPVPTFFLLFAGKLVEALYQSLLSVKSIHLQMFRPVQVVVLAVEGKTDFCPLRIYIAINFISSVYFSLSLLLN